MILKRGKFAVGFIVLFTLGVWVGIAFVFKLAVLDYPYVQLGYFIWLAGLVVVGLVFARYTNELGRVEVKGKVLTAHRLLGKPLFSIPLKEIEGYAVTENDTDLGAVYNLILAAKNGIRFLSLWGIGGERWRIQKHLGKQRYRKELLKWSIRRDIMGLGVILALLGAMGLGYCLLKEAAENESPGEVAEFQIPFSGFKTTYSDEGVLRRTELTDGYANNFNYEVDDRFFTYQEMIPLHQQLETAPEIITIWTYDRAFRRKIREENVALGFYQKHWHYGTIPILQISVNNDTFGDWSRFPSVSDHLNEIATGLATLVLIVGSILVWWGIGPRLK